MSGYPFSRRHFFFGTLLAGAIPRAGFGSQPSLKALGYKSFNEKMGIACIGLGMRGPQVLPHHLDNAPSALFGDGQPARIISFRWKSLSVTTASIFLRYVPIAS